MAEALKDIYNEALIDRTAAEIKRAFAPFDTALWKKLVFDENWERQELKQRIRHIAESLRQTLPADYTAAIQVLRQAAPHCSGLGALFFPDFVEVYGLEHWDESVEALKEFTEYSTGEFAVRPFIERDPQRMLAIMLEWSASDNEHVRRLASEGCRPRLPWGRALVSLKREPAPILPILEALKQDESLYVRKSVANNLNDIAKDHPDLVKSIAQRWYGTHPHTDWIIKHACRGLLRQGDAEMLALFGFQSMEGVYVDNLNLDRSELHIGDKLLLAFELGNKGNEPRKLRVEYGVDFVKANGKTSRKLFKITENVYDRGAAGFSRSHAFADLTTRKHYPGIHRIAIVINGVELASAEFRLLP
ncbi:DNA alkylation repair protein [Paenibacillus thalictri]|uniref:DNA alkylation repair protein n=1 Tax=Paenibacillus thalictri TaxID=2527873 RepID=A0A4Q9DWG0_9BACL|nr:DNA alkylation repair protein [Paenibacillus thalictri]TBL80736.1 DNA alkylation repair protein [Paenibacillus thalictri]